MAPLYNSVTYASQKIMSIQIKYAHCTVPSSGTRYVNHTLEEAGLVGYDCRMEDPDGADFGWGHFQNMYRGKVWEMLEGADKAWITVRDPIMSWATGWEQMQMEMLEKFSPERAHRAQVLGDRNNRYWEQQNLYHNSHTIPIFRVDKDSVEGLGDYLGLELKASERKHSRGNYALKSAVEDQDPERIEYITEGTSYWSRFVYEASPIMAPFYDKLGYDLWWI